VAARGVRLVSWPANLSPRQSLRLLRTSASDTSSTSWRALTDMRGLAWQTSTALTVLSLVASNSLLLVSPSVWKALLPASTQVVPPGVRRGRHAHALHRAATPFFQCDRFFKCVGNFSVTLEETDEGTEQGGESGLWLRLSSAPSGPMALRLLLVAREGECVLDLRFEFRGDNNIRLRIPVDTSEDKALETLRRALRAAVAGVCDDAIVDATDEGCVCDVNVNTDWFRRSCDKENLDSRACAKRSLSLLLQLGMPVGDLEGRAACSGWIPWKPARPSVLFLR